MNYDTINCYPVFETNQILTSTHLNRLFEFLDHENRKSREIIAGTGIICGLEVTFNKTNHSVKISKGKGLTKEAYALVSKLNLTFSKYREYKPQDQSVYKPFSPANVTSVPLELLPQNTDVGGAKSLKSLGLKKLKDKIVVIFLDYRDEEAKTCTGTSCDNKGKRRIFDIKFLLVEKSYLSLIDLESLILNECKLPFIKLPRFHTQFLPDGLESIAKPSQINKAYLKIVTDNRNAIISAIQESYKKYCAFLGLYELDLQPLADLKTKSFDLEEAQYVYDYFNDLIEAYYEFKNTAYKIYKQCAVQYNDYPRHLMLGRLIPENTGTIDQYRNYFINSTYSDDLSYGIYAAQILFRKILFMVSSFSVPTVNNTKMIITPSLTGVPLSCKSIPYYYKNIPKLAELWNPFLSKQIKSKEQLSYHQKEYNKSPVIDEIANPLSYTKYEYSFNRFEGHHLQPYSLALQEYRKLIDQNNLSCDIQALKLNGSETINNLLEHCRVDDLQAVYMETRFEYLALMRDAEVYWDETFYHKLDEEDAALLKKYTDSNFSRNLKNLYDLLPYCLESFNFESFNKGYIKIRQTVAQKYLLLQHIWGKTYLWKGRIIDPIKLEELRQIIQTLLKQLGNILTGQHNKKFHHVFYLLKYRLEYLQKNHPKIFSNFNKKYKGLEHLEGAYDYGTFFLIYQDENKPAVIADFFLPIKCCCGCCELPDCKTESAAPRPPLAQDYYHPAIIGKKTLMPLNYGDDVNLEPKIKITHLPKLSEIGNKLTLEKNAFVYQAIKKYSGFDSFVYEITDSRTGLKDNGIVTVYVHEAMKEHIKAVDDLAATAKGKEISIDLLANDIVYENTSIIEAGESLLGADINIKHKSITYTPGEAGKDQFDYTIFDQDRNEKSTAQVNVFVFCCKEDAGGCNAVDIPVTIAPNETVTIYFKEFLGENTAFTNLVDYPSSIFEIDESRDQQTVTINASGGLGTDIIQIKYNAVNPDTGDTCSANIIITPAPPTVNCDMPPLNLPAKPDKTISVELTGTTLGKYEFINFDPVPYDVAIIEFVDIKKLLVTPGGYFSQAGKSYTINFQYRISESPDKICVGQINLNSPFIAISVVEGINTDVVNTINNDVNIVLIEENPVLAENTSAVAGFLDTLIIEHTTNKSSLESGTRTNFILEKYKSATEPLIEDIKATNILIEENGATPELTARNKLNADLYKNATLAIANTLGGLEKDLDKRSNAYKYLDSSVIENFAIINTSSDLDLTNIKEDYKTRFTEKNNLTNVVNRIIG